MVTMIVAELLVIVYLAACVCYNFAFSVAGRFLSATPAAGLDEGAPCCRIVVLIPAYKEDNVIVNTAKSYDSLNYPRASYDVVVIADSLQSATISKLLQEGLYVLPVQFTVSTKAKALHAALEALPPVYDIALVCDADNVLERDFLLKVNRAYRRGHPVIQAQRVAKNLDMPFAILDAANEMIANHIHRKGANAFRLSASLAGSGIAVDFQLLRETMQQAVAIGGFGEDKVLQQLIVERGHRIHYLEEALIYDEKVSNARAFENQRKRWLFGQLYCLRQNWWKGNQELLNGNIDYWYISVWQNLLLPRLLLLAATLSLSVIYLFFNAYLAIPSYCWIALLGMCCGSLLLPLPVKFYSRFLLRAVWHLPWAMFLMLMLVFRNRKANSAFIHTPHHKTGVDNVLFDRKWQHP